MQQVISAAGGVGRSVPRDLSDFPAAAGEAGDGDVLDFISVTKSELSEGGSKNSGKAQDLVESSMLLTKRESSTALDEMTPGGGGGGGSFNRQHSGVAYDEIDSIRMLESSLDEELERSAFRHGVKDNSTTPVEDSVYSPLRSRDATIEPPDLFNTNKTADRSPSVRGSAEGPRTTLKVSENMRSNSWDNKENNKSFGDTHTLRKPKSSSSHSRSKRMRNRSLEMVLDEPNNTDSSATKRYL